MNSVPDAPQAGPDSAVPEHYLLDGVVQVDELLWIYHTLLATDAWTLTRTSNKPALSVSPFMSFPGLEVETQGKVHLEFLSGYFHALLFRLRALAMDQHGLVLPPRVARIHVGAKASTSKSEFHVDSKVEGTWTILGFLNPEWNSADGGEFYLQDHRIEFKSGRFVVFRSGVPHNGGFVTNEKLTYWRVAVNYILGDNKQT